MSEPEIICETHGPAGVVVLNRPQALNALTLGMVRALAGALDRWEQNRKITRIVLSAAGGRAFCAGGDIRLLHDQGRRGDHAAQLQFWREEYTLNQRIKRYPKPVVALVDGIVMGGGVGLSVHATHRVAGDRFLFAMPETSIGFFPDIGATYFLPRLPGRIGTYLALTGTRVATADAVACGLATTYTPSAALADLAEALCEEGDPGMVLTAFAAAAPPASLLDRRAWIDGCFSAATLAAILSGLDRAAAHGFPEAADAEKAIRANAPLSVSIALRQMQIGGSLTFEAAMRTEFRIVSRLCRGHDFYEGVRATIIDRDNHPRWLPARIEEVTTAQVDAHFSDLGDDDLALSPRPGVTAGVWA